MRGGWRVFGRLLELMRSVFRRYKSRKRFRLRGRWEVRCSREIFDQQIADERLHMLLTLGRIVNAMRFTQQAVEDIRDPDKPASTRQRINSLLFLGAILCEGMGLARHQLGKHFRHLPSFKNGFQELGRDQQVEALLRSNTGKLWKMRNEVVFHYDREAISYGVGSFPEEGREGLAFVSGYRDRVGDIHYDLSDNVVIRYVIGAIKEDDESSVRSKLKRLIDEVLSLSHRFGRAADELIMEGLKELRWVATEMQD